MEADYLVGVLNAPVITELARPLMSYGKDERDIDTHVWKLPIPGFAVDDVTHQRVAELSAALALEVASLTLPANFVTARRAVRDHVVSSVLGQELNALVEELVSAE
jgi:hypothetical protein